MKNKTIERIHEKETAKVRDFGELYKQNLIDIVWKVQELETKTSELGYDVILDMYDLDMKQYSLE